MYKKFLYLFCFFVLLVAVDRLVATFLRVGLERYFGLNKPAAVLCVGHSRMVLGLDRALLADRLGVSVAKYGMDGVNTFDRCAMVRYFLKKHPKVKLVLYDVESTAFANAKLSANSYRLFLPFIGDSDMLRYVREECPSKLQFWLYRLLHSSRYDDASVNRTIRGWLGYDKNLKSGVVDLKRLQARIDSDRIRSVAVDDNNFMAFRSLIDELSQNGIRVVLWHPPTIDVLDDVHKVARDKVRMRFNRIAAKNSKVDYFEYVDEYREQHDIFYDGIHMNSKGRKLITTKLCEDIKNLKLVGTANLAN